MKKNDIHFEISERKVLLRIMDIVSVLATLFLVHKVFEFEYFKGVLDNGVRLAVLVLYLSVFGSILELYDLAKASNRYATAKNVILTASVTILFYLLTPIYSPDLPANRLQILFFFLAIVLSISLWRLAYITLIAAPRFYKRVLLIADGGNMKFIIENLEKSDPNYKIVAALNTSTGQRTSIDNVKVAKIGNIASLVLELNISEIVVASHIGGGITKELNSELLGLLEKGVSIRSFISVYEDLTYRIPVQHLERDFYDFFPFSRSNHNKLYLFFNRIMDVILSLVGLLFGILLLPIVIVGNLIGNRGCLFYHQIRVGRNGNHFKIYKLRSMVKDAEKDGAQFSYKGDSRITKFGAFLRRTRLDEFPQFINVLKGDMSIIGPRPERPEFVSMLNEKIPFYEVRHVVKPGITGWAQVNAKYGENTEDSLEKLQYDLYYIKHRSMFLDISIVTKTLSTIVFFRGQ